MIIDLILDRKDGTPYSPRKFYHDTMAYGPIGVDITRARMALKLTGAAHALK